MWPVIYNVVARTLEVFNECVLQFKSSMIASDVYAHGEILSRALLQNERPATNFLAAGLSYP
jgi:hypothetical protein